MLPKLCTLVGVRLRSPPVVLRAVLLSLRKEVRAESSQRSMDVLMRWFWEDEGLAQVVAGVAARALVSSLMYFVKLS